MKGEVKKLKFKPLTLDDILVKEGLNAISNLTGREPYYLVGGIAAQSYLPTSCRRPTSDIDISIVKPLNYKDFKIISKPVVEYLLDNKYNVKLKKCSRAFHLNVENSTGERLLIEFSRRNKKCFDNSRKKLERELENSKRKIVEDSDSTYVVSSPEDIIVPKLVRSIGSLIRNPQLEEYIPDENLSDDYIRKRLNFIKKLREDAMFFPYNLDLAEELKFVSDIYDIRILSEITGINQKYFKESSKDWRVLSKNLQEKNILFNFILPKINDNALNNDTK